MNHIQQIATEVFNIEAEAILNLRKILTPSFEGAVQRILEINGRVIITGIGKSGLIGAKIAATLSSTGTPSFFLHPVEAFHGDLGMVTSDDIVLMISYSGNADELLRLVPFLQERNIEIISFTGNPESLLAKNSNYHINIAVEREACPLNLAPTSSSATTLAMGDAIAVTLMKLRNFQESDFAQFHPGGNLGYRLLTKAKGVMRTENLPIVRGSQTVAEALVTMSKGKLGMAIVTEGKKIEGIFTDGDLRRTLEKGDINLSELAISEVMTPNPKTIHYLATISEVEEEMKKNVINAILVVDEHDTLVGVIDNIKLR